MRRTTCQVLIMTALVACTGTRTGNPVGGDDGSGHGGTTGTGNTAEGAIGNCDPKPSDLGSLDQQTRLGFSANDVLAFAAGVHETKIRWQEGGLGTFGPESGEHGLRVEITPSDAKPRLVEYEEHMSAGGAEPAIEIGLPYAGCQSLASLEIDVDVAVASDSGALDETLHGTLRAQSTSWATLQLDIDAADLGGELALESSQPEGFELDAITIALGLSPLGVRGDLQATLIMPAPGGDGTSGAAAGGAAGRGGVATIGDAAACDEGGFEVALDDKLHAIDAQDAVDRINALHEVALSWKGGATARASITFEPGDGAVCAVLDPAQLQFVEPGAAGLLRVHGTLHVTSNDDRITADWPVVLDALAADDGTLGPITLTLSVPDFDEAAALDVEAHFGIRGIDTSGYDTARVSFTLQIGADAAGDVSGMLTVNGVNHAVCPPPPSDPSMGSPGCAGDDVTELDSALIARAQP